jgi:hypothetical protein
MPVAFFAFLVTPFLLPFDLLQTQKESRTMVMTGKAVAVLLLLAFAQVAIGSQHEGTFFFFFRSL